MTAQLLDGNALLEAVKADLIERVKRLGDRGVTPGLGTILVGDDPNSASYVRMKHENSAEIGITSFHQELPADVSQERLFAAISEFTPRNVQSADERGHQVFGVKVRVDNSEGIFKSGMAAEVTVPLAP